MTDQQPTMQPGWYPDPTQHGNQREWNGQEWVGPSVPVGGQKKGGFPKWLIPVIACLGLAFVAVIGGAIASSGEDDDKAAEVRTERSTTTEGSTTEAATTESESAGGDDLTPCQQAGVDAAAGRDFDLDACTSYSAFKSAYEAAPNGGVLSDNEAIQLLAPKCGAEPEGTFCEDVYATLVETTTTAAPTTTTTAPPAQPIVQTGQGDGDTAPFDVPSGTYKVTYQFDGDCYYSATMERTDGGFAYIDLGSGTGPVGGETFAYNVEGGEHYVSMITGPAPGCAWTITLTPQD